MLDFAFGIYWFITKLYLSSVLWALMFLVFGYVLVKKGVVSQHFGKRLFLWFAAILALQLIAVSADLWIEWHRYGSCGTACQFFFPPHSNFYFNEGIVRWLSSFAFDACVGLIGGICFSLFARFTKGRIIDQLDVDLLTVGGMVAGWPNILLFYGFVFVLTVFVTIAKAAAVRSAGIRMIITPVLPFAAACIALFGDTLAKALKIYEIGVTLF
ncbi:MAG: hypothetical protein V1907_00635 [Candidatus Kerfeldbacteria bacterium]